MNRYPKMKASTFESIPREVYDMIVELLVDARDLNSLCKTSKRMYEMTVTYLYKSISLCAHDHAIDKLGPLLSRASGERGLLRHTRHIKVWSDSSRKRDNRCVHAKKSQDNNEDEDYGLKIALEGCESGAIRSLDWAFGTCVPHTLLGPTGYLNSKQQNIESIRLITDSTCLWDMNERSRHRLTLGAFPHLKRLSWAGLTPQAELDLDDVLERRSRQLEEFEIDVTCLRSHASNVAHFYAWRGHDDDDDASLLSSFDIPRRWRFTILKRLALAAVPFTAGETWCIGHIKFVYDVLDFSSLQSLRLRQCPGWGDFIRMLNASAQPPKLKSLELHCAPTRNGDPIHAQELLTFLYSFQGLEELFLSTAAPTDPLEIWQAALHHRASLRRFVHHQRVVHHLSWGSEPRSDSVVDIQDLGFHDPVDVEYGSADLLGRLDLTSLGLCCIPSFMQSFVSHFARKTSLQVLHMRQSGTDLHHYDSCWATSANEDDVPFDFAGTGLPDGTFPKLGKSFVDFAQWVFGPTGIGSLRLLAYGDFSCDGRFGHSTLLFCRQDTSEGSGTGDASRRLRFREVFEGDDVELWELYKREKDVLTACPSADLFGN